MWNQNGKSLSTEQVRAVVQKSQQLARLRQRFDVAADATERIERCTICGGSLHPFCNVDRYGYSVQFVVCRNCVTVLLNPRLNDAAYDRFYRDHYREFIHEYSGETIEQQESFSRLYLRQIHNAIAKYLNDLHTAIDIGGGNGVNRDELLAGGFKQVDIVDPGLKPGLEGTAESFMSWKSNGQHYDVAFVMHTIDHMPDPVLMLTKTRMVADHLVIDMIDFPRRWVEWQHGALKIDHPTNLSEISMQLMLIKTGWKVRHKHYTHARHTIAYFCDKSEMHPDATPPPGTASHLLERTLCSTNTSPYRMLHLAVKSL